MYWGKILAKYYFEGGGTKNKDEHLRWKKNSKIRKKFCENQQQKISKYSHIISVRQGDATSYNIANIKNEIVLYDLCLTIMTMTMMIKSWLAATGMVNTKNTYQKP